MPPKLVQRLSAAEERESSLLFHLIGASQAKSRETTLRAEFGEAILEGAHSKGFVTRSPEGIYSITLKGREALREYNNRATMRHELAQPEAPVVPAPAVPKPAEAIGPAAMQPWEMVLRDYIATAEAQSFRRLKDIGSPEIQHRLSVRQALSEGKPVPAEVLKDYPDLAARAVRPAEAVVEAKIPTLTAQTRLNMGRTQGNRLALKESGIEFEPDNPTISEIVGKLDELETKLSEIPTRLAGGPKFRKLDNARILILRLAENETGLTETGLKNVAKGLPPPTPPVPRAAEAVAPTPKQPWEMTLSEYGPIWVQEATENARRANIYVGKPAEVRANASLAHYFEVQRAIKAGKPVPAEVLKDYPDLAAKFSKVAPQTTPRLLETEIVNEEANMPTILGGRVQVPDSQCAMRWHELLFAARIMMDVKALIYNDDYYQAEQSLDLLSGNLATVSLEPEIKDIKEKMARQETRGAIIPVHEALESRILSGLVQEVYECECQAKSGAARG